MSDHNGENLYSFSDQNGSKTIPFGAAHTYIADIGKYPPPPPRVKIAARKVLLLRPSPIIGPYFSSPGNFFFPLEHFKMPCVCSSTLGETNYQFAIRHDSGAQKTSFKIVRRLSLKG